MFSHTQCFFVQWFSSHWSRANVLMGGRKSNLCIFSDPNQRLNGVIDSSRISFGSIFACGREKRGTHRKEKLAGVPLAPPEIRRLKRVETSLQNKGLECFCFIPCSKRRRRRARPTNATLLNPEMSSSAAYWRRTWMNERWRRFFWQNCFQRN